MTRRQAACRALAAALAVAALVWLWWGPSAASAAATDLPPLPAKVGVQEKAGPPPPLPANSTPEERQNWVLACMAYVHLRVRPADITWVTRGNTAQALTGLEWVDTTAQGGQ